MSIGDLASKGVDICAGTGWLLALSSQYAQMAMSARPPGSRGLWAVEGDALGLVYQLGPAWMSAGIALQVLTRYGGQGTVPGVLGQGPHWLHTGTTSPLHVSPSHPSQERPNLPGQVTVVHVRALCRE